MNFELMKQLVKKILENATSYEWSLQGLGMLRLYLSQEVRLHVWDCDFMFPKASTMHTHPWHFSSLIVAGELKQMRYVEDKEGDSFNVATIQCGEGGCLVTEPETIKLAARPMEYYREGQTYSELAEEIHESFPTRGTVTLVTRTFTEDRDHAKVYWPKGHVWGSAEPRPATQGEVYAITSHALSRWFAAGETSATGKGA
jgi:hypothetical protein